MEKQFTANFSALLLFFCLWGSHLALAQSGSISGKITNASTNEALIGGTVQVVGTTLGTVTDVEGNYRLAGVPAGKSIRLLIKNVGYKDKEIAVSLSTGENKTLDITLEEAELFLDDVVVTGLAVQTKQKELGTSRATVSGKTIEELPAVTVEDALLGRLAGVETYSTDGTPGGGFRFRMRGGNSIIGSSEPLVIVDGIYMDNSNRNTTSGANTGVASFGMNNGTRGLGAVNPEDIESMEVLKGAAAAALYGARGSSGVIVIKTKSGAAGKASLDYALDAGFTEVHRGVLNYKNNWASGEISQWADLINAQVTNSVLRYSPTEISQWQGNPSKDWLLEPFQRGTFTRHTLRLTGGTEKLSYYASVSSQRNLGHQKGTNYGADGFRVSITARPTDKLEIRASADYSADTRLQLPGGSPGFFVVNQWARNSNAMPFMRLQDVRNPLSTGFNAVRPEGAGRDLGIYSPDDYVTLRKENKIGRVIGGINMKYNILDNLAVDVNFGVDNSNIEGKMIYPYGLVGLFPQGRLDIDNETIRAKTLTIGLNHAWKINDAFNLKSAIGMQYDDNTRTYNYVRFQNRSPITPEDFLGSYTTFNAGSNIEFKDILKTTGVYINETLGYKDKIFLNLGGRMDKTTAFSNQFYFYPRAALSYVATQTIRLRAAVGSTGTQPPAYSSLPTFAVDAGGFDGASAVRYAVIGNPNLKPETQTEIEIGGDVSFLKGRINVELTYYNKSFKDLLLNSASVNPALAANKGSTTNIQNIGTMRNQGLEFSVNMAVIDNKDFKWNLSFTGATLDNKVTSLSIGGVTPPVLLGGLLNVARIVEGYPLSGLWGIIPESANSSDFRYLGSPYAKLDFNINNQLDYKGLYFRMLWGGKSGMKKFNATARDLAAPTTRMHEDYWNTPRTDLVGATGTGGVFNNFSQWVQDASFLKLRFLTLGYNVPRNVLNGSFFKASRVKSLNVSLTGANLLTFSSYKGGYDIESETSGSGGGNAWVRGIDSWEAGIPRSYTFSLNIGF
jgi:TonB-linked SusC/RagA family outer membrane protein